MEEENEEFETYEEVPSEEDYEDSSTFEDIIFISFMAVLVCAVFAFIIKTISKHLKNIHLKVGNKIELGIDTKDTDKKESK